MIWPAEALDVRAMKTVSALILSNSP